MSTKLQQIVEIYAENLYSCLD